MPSCSTNPDSRAVRHRVARGRGFTLVEVLAASAVLMLILALTLVLVSNLTRATVAGAASPGAFQEARTAFETMTRMASQAVLKTYWDYDNPGVPRHYLRASELHFMLGPADTLTGFGANAAGNALFFQAPLSRTSDPGLKRLPDLLNTLGFYVRFSESDDLPPFLSAGRAATAGWRLWLAFEPAEALRLYTLYGGDPQRASNTSWFTDTVATPARNHVLANNVVLLLVRALYQKPEIPGGTPQWVWSYAYDSRGQIVLQPPQPSETHQLPPVLTLTMVVIDSRSAARLLAAAGGRYDLVPGGLFADAGQYSEDIQALTDHLDSQPFGGGPVSYRIFETTVNVASAKWSL